MLFRSKIQQYKYTLIDIVVGCTATVVVAFFIIVACASTLHAKGIVINEAKDAAMALEPLAGALSSHVFAFGLFIASIFSATILPLATAFYVCEAFGFEAGIDKKWEEAPEFYVLYTSIIILGVVIILIPNAPHTFDLAVSMKKDGPVMMDISDLVFAWLDQQLKPKIK